MNVITDAGGFKCQLNPWGGVSRSEGPTPGSQPTCDLTHRFTGQELDPETGLYYYGGRYYDQEISRFVSPDPYVQEPDEPQNLNRYTYVLNNPQGYVDPSGYIFGFDDLIYAIIAIIKAMALPSVEGATIGGLSATAAQAIAATFATAWTTSLTYALKSNAELGNDKVSPGQSGTNVQQNTSIASTTWDDLGNFYPKKDSWLLRLADRIGGCRPGDDVCSMGAPPIILAEGGFFRIPRTTPRQGPKPKRMEFKLKHPQPKPVDRFDKNQPTEKMRDKFPEAVEGPHGESWQCNMLGSTFPGCGAGGVLPPSRVPGTEQIPNGIPNDYPVDLLPDPWA